MSIQMLPGATFFRGEKLRLNLYPTKNRGGGRVERIPVPSDGIVDLSVAMTALPTIKPEPFAMKVTCNGVAIYEGAESTGATQLVKFESRLFRGAAKLTLDFDFANVEPELCAVAVNAGIEGPTYHPTKSAKFRLSSGARPGSSAPPETPTEEEKPDGFDFDAEAIPLQ